MKLSRTRLQLFQVILTTLLLIVAVVIFRKLHERLYDLKANATRYGMQRLPPAGIPEGRPLVDRYGQSTLSEWPGKVTADSDLKEAAAAERLSLAASPAPPDIDEWGGWTKGPTLKSTGFFRVDKSGGNWWFIDPAGKLFFSLGIDTVSDDPTGYATQIAGRSSLFAALPMPFDPLADQYGDCLSQGATSPALCYNFYDANLQRKFGPDWKEAWCEETGMRMRAWGFNTVGVWSSGCRDANDEKPYVISIGIKGDYNTIKTGADWWGPMPDVFDPGFATGIRSDVLSKTRGIQSDPWLVGYFVDNEPSWWGSAKPGILGIKSDRKLTYGVPIGALRQDAAMSPVKKAFVMVLSNKYGAIQSLNEAWQSHFSSWSALNAPYVVPASPDKALNSDLSMLLSTYADRYFSSIYDILKAADPNHLYLGCRFAGSAPSEVVSAAAKYCDVLSVNSYAPQRDRHGWPLFSGVDKPFLISEFSAGSLDSGMFGAGLVDAGSQKGRGEYYSDYLMSALRNPKVVGCHWFEYVDEPVVGRSFDGENSNFGLVNVIDRPYAVLVSAATHANFESYKLRSAH